MESARAQGSTRRLLSSLHRRAYRALFEPPNLPQYGGTPRTYAPLRLPTLAEELQMGLIIKMHRHSCCARCMRAGYENDLEN
jgi:hypothetical protein